MDCPLSSELKVACEIYRMNIEKKPVWYGKLVELLDGTVNKETVSQALDTLSDWLIVRGHYGPLGDGRAGYLWEIEPDSVHVIRPLYEKYWKAPYIHS